MASLLPTASKHLLLFADGKTDTSTVSYADTRVAADAQRALAILLADHDAEEPVLTRVPKLNVAARWPGPLAHDFRPRPGDPLWPKRRSGPRSLLLYFAGHGTQDEKDETNTHYDLWDNEELKVRDLAAELSRLPRQVPVVLVMAQCFSGAFANVLFRGSDPKEGTGTQRMSSASSRPRKTMRQRAAPTPRSGRITKTSPPTFLAPSAATTASVTRSAAQTMTGMASVSLYEAFCYALIHDLSADTPVCTSDVFLQARASLPDATIYGTPYQEVWQAGTPAQRAVLDAHFPAARAERRTSGLSPSYDRLTYGDPAASPASLLKAENETKEQLNVLRQQMLGPLFERWPALRWGDTANRVTTRKAFKNGAVDELVQR